jgi:hypothetical protein
MMKWSIFVAPHLGKVTIRCGHDPRQRGMLSQRLCLSDNASHPGAIMIKRRTFIVGAGLAAVGAAAHLLTRGSDYRAAADALWSHRPFAEGPDLVCLVHCATLAANSHNAQPWRFRATPEGISLRPDPGRMLPVADPDNHHLYASLGCAAENLMLAAGAAGRSCTVAFSAGGDGRVDVRSGRVPAGATRCSRASSNGSAPARTMMPVRSIRLHGHRCRRRPGSKAAT